MNDDEAKVRRWWQYIEECRKEATFLSPEGQKAMQTVIDSYEKLIAKVRDQDKRMVKSEDPSRSPQVR